jgi:hypothetical protein
MITFSVVVAIYVGFNLFVTRRISKAFYMDEEMRRRHRKFIWFVPFIGPLLITGFWRKAKKVKFDTLTKQQRDKNMGDFYESGIGLDS